MTVADYKEKKRIESLPKMWVVFSNRDGVTFPFDVQIVDIVSGVSFVLQTNDIKHEPPLRVDRYILGTKEIPIDIEEGKTSGHESGYGTGIGDLWEWSRFCTFNEKEANEYYELELKRVREKYK